MPEIQVLDPHVADLIAAGEVVERPASVAKELMENAIDAGARSVTVEIAHGGLTFLRVTDDGCGIPAPQMKTAFLRHATSKLRTEYDLEAIGTLGFRGEALAAISAVSRIDVMSRTQDAPLGASLSLEGGVAGPVEQAGCPLGTTMVVRDLFYNTPARLKFMKKDAAEGAAVFGVVQRVALSHPEVAVKFLRDGKQELATPGDGQLRSAVYAVLGRDLALGFTQVDSSDEGMSVSGFVSQPSCCRASRNWQFFFVNGRQVKSRLMMAALEEAYPNQKMVGKFPGCVLHLTTRLSAVDVNVHPAKTEVKFGSERGVFSAVYHAVLSALERDHVRPAVALEKPRAHDTVTPNQTRLSAGELPLHDVTYGRREVPGLSRMPSAASFLSPQQRERTPQPAPAEPPHPRAPISGEMTAPGEWKTGEAPAPACPGEAQGGMTCHDRMAPEDFDLLAGTRTERPAPAPAETPAPDPGPAPALEEGSAPQISAPAEPEPEGEAAPWRIAGEVLNTYIIVEQGDTILFIDKHAAHERMNFDRMKAEGYTPMVQTLLTPVTLHPPAEEGAALLANLPLLEEFGFYAEDFGGGALVVRQAPFDVDPGDIEDTLLEIGGRLLTTGRADPSAARDELLHTMACKAAIKGGWRTSPQELEKVAGAVMRGEVKYCPHGRPVAIELTRKDLEKQFRRA